MSDRWGIVTDSFKDVIFQKECRKIVLIKYLLYKI